MVKKWAFLIILITAFMCSCGEYSRVVKSTDLKYKHEMALKYYNEGEYYKAVPLIEELLIIYRGTEKAEKLHYYNAYCDFKLGDLIIASHRFRTFAQTYPRSERSEECSFMSAYCFYRNSPQSSLDQTNTYRAIKELQLFVNRFPTSTRLDSCNKLIDGLRYKLETKYFNIAKQYLHTRKYKSAIVDFENLLVDFPDTEYREEASFLLLKSQFLLAIRSIDSKKEERLSDTMNSYVKFVDSFANGQYIKEAESIYSGCEKEKAKIAKKTI